MLFASSLRLSALLSFLGVGSLALAAEPLKIGLSGPYTGGSSSLGVSMRNGVRLAVEEVNKAGGVLGRPIQLIERDDEAKNELGAQIAQELINKEQVVATLGFINTGVALAALRYYQEAEIPVIVNASAGSVVTRQFLPPTYPHNYVFRISAHDLLQSAFIVQEAIVKRGYKKPAILHDTTNYGVYGRGDLEKALEAVGIKPVAAEKFNIGDTDMTAQVLKAKESGADVLFTYAVGPELAQVLKAKAKLGWDVPVIGSWGLSMSNFIDAAGPSAEGAVMPQVFFERPSTPKRKAFIDAYHKAYGVDRIPSPVAAAQGYDSVYVLKAAITQAKSTQGVKIREALENLQEKVEGVVTIYDRPFTTTDHEAITNNMVMAGVVKNGRVEPAYEVDVLGEHVVRLKAK